MQSGRSKEKLARWRSRPIEDLGLPKFMTFYLRRSGLETVGLLLLQGESDLRKIVKGSRNCFGQRSIDLIQEVLAEKGLPKLRK